MSFSEALIHLKNGYECKLEKAHIHLWHGRFYIRHRHGNYSLVQWYADHESLLSEDWEVGEKVPDNPIDYNDFIQGW